MTSSPTRIDRKTLIRPNDTVRSSHPTGGRVRRREHHGARGPRGRAQAARHVHRRRARRLRRCTTWCGKSSTTPSTSISAGTATQSRSRSTSTARSRSKTTVAAFPSTCTQTRRQRGRGRDDGPARGRQVRSLELQGQRGSPRRRRERRQRRLRERCSSRSSARARSTSRSTARRSRRRPSSHRRDRRAPARRSPSSPITRSSQQPRYSYDILANRLRELAFLNSGLDDRARRTSAAKGERDSSSTRAASRSSSQLLSQTKEPVHEDVVAFTASSAEGERQGAGQRRLRDPVDRALRSRSSATRTTSTTRTAARTSRACAPRSRARSTATARRRTCSRTSKNGLSGDDIARRRDLRHPRQAPGSASFDSQTKSKLVSSEVKGIVENVVQRAAGALLRGAPADRAQDPRKGRCMAAKAREAARKAREVVRKGVLDMHEPLRQARRLSEQRSRRRARSTSSRVRAPAAPPSRAATGISRRSCRSRARS